MKKIITAGVLYITCLLFGCGPKSAHEDSADRGDTTGKADLTAVKQVDTAKVTPADKLIIPGKSIGKIAVNGRAGSAEAIFGKPDSSDAAMGSSLMTWNLKGNAGNYKISIFSAHNFGAKDEAIARIRKIMVTSPDYKTADGLGAGSPLTDFQKHFDLKRAGGYTSNGKNVKVFEAKKEGITFEVDSASNKCTAIIVHLPKDTLATYINMH